MRPLCNLVVAVLVAVTTIPATPQRVVTSSAPAASTGVGKFEDVTEKIGIHFQHQAPPTSKKYLLQTVGSGVALFDYDNDGRLDIFLGNGARIDDPTPKDAIPEKDGLKYWNRLYRRGCESRGGDRLRSCKGSFIRWLNHNQ